MDSNPDPARKSPTDLPTNAPAYCAFCTETLAGKDFRAFSKILPFSAICGDCIGRFAVMNKFACETFDIHFSVDQDYSPLKSGILKRLFSATGSIRMKKAVADIAIRLLMQASARIMHKKDHPNAPELKYQRFALVCENIESCSNLFRVACSETAMAYMETTKQDLEDGSAFDELLKVSANGEIQWASLGVLYCNGYVKTNAGCGVVYGCNTTERLPANIEIFNIE